MNNILVNLAYNAFKNKEYSKALQLYKILSKKYGEKFYSANIKVCESKLKNIEIYNTTFNLLAPMNEVINQKIKALCILDQYSEFILSNQIDIIKLDKDNYIKQIQKEDYDLIFLESCWNGNDGMWLYAFTSPGLIHANAQKLIDCITNIKKFGKKIVFWNKEDPMHFDKFLPIARYCDFILTTDYNCVEKYKKILKRDNVGVLQFFINPTICNPRNRARFSPASVCFAGAYYSQGHDERKMQMDYILPVVLNNSGIIYDRYSEDKTGKYKYPGKYNCVIHKSVPFSEMPSIYKKFKVFLNVNTITNSPTMMSRRVYEILGSGTPVVSSPSLAIEKQFPNIVLTASSTNEAEYHVKNLLSDEEYWNKISHIGYREVMEKYTYNNINTIIYEAGGISRPKYSKPLVSIILASRRENNTTRIIKNISCQIYDNIEIILALTDYSRENIERIDKALHNVKNIRRIKCIIFGKDVPLGRCINESIRESNGDFIAKFDDDNYYFEHYLSDMLIPFQFCDFDVVGKESYFCYLEGFDRLILRYPNRNHRDTNFVAGDAMIIRRSIFEKTCFGESRVGEDTALLKNIIDLGGKIYSTDYFNFIKFRSSNLLSQTWIIEEEELLKNSISICKGLNFEHVRC